MLKIISARGRQCLNWELKDNVGELWRRYRSLEPQDANADLVMALIRKLIVQQAVVNLRDTEWSRLRARSLCMLATPCTKN